MSLFIVIVRAVPSTAALENDGQVPPQIVVYVSVRAADAPSGSVAV